MEEGGGEVHDMTSFRCIIHQEALCISAGEGESNGFSHAEC
jgi:hypothetical protein